MTQPAPGDLARAEAQIVHLFGVVDRQADELARLRALLALYTRRLL